MNYKRILIAVDDSSYSMKAARVGFEMAHKLKAEVGILYVISKMKEQANPDLGTTEHQQHNLLLAEAENAIRQYIDLYDGIDKVYRFTPEGLPEAEIIHVAKEWDADMIVMGTHGRSGLSRILTGSIAEYVIKHAEIPVLITTPRMK
ncbi:universal stress protein [Olivibacter ginsenosidimutans]|uniref:Universal stress protein n=1 Tax=Olivibacter ginsenosidimutans TaxID=1176537 RepID=A0ABP9AWB2_9SPHI